MGHVGYMGRLVGCLLVDRSVPRRERDRPPVAVRVVEEVRVADRLHCVLRTQHSYVSLDRTRAHSQYMVVKNFYEAIKAPATASELGPETAGLLHKLFQLYALHTLEAEASEFFASAATTVRQIQLARTSAVMKLMEQIRPHAIRLVDAWAFPDWQLDSSIGRYDGKVYEDMFHRASEQNPLNRIVVDPYPESTTLFKKND